MPTPLSLSLDTKLPIIAILVMAAWSGSQGVRIERLEKDSEDMEQLVKEICASMHSIEMLLLQHVAGHEVPAPSDVTK